MRCVILAGGFAVRLLPLTLDRPKALLPIAGKTIIEYLLEKLELVKEIDLIYVSTNKKFESHLLEEINELKIKKPIKLIVEPVTKEEEKFGAIGALEFLIKREKINDDLLVIAGDNLFDFSLQDFVNYQKEKKSAIVALCDLKDPEKIKGKYGVVVLDKNNKIMEFQEKPAKPKSTFVSIGCYLFPKETLKLIPIYLANNNPDAPGYFITWLCKKQAIYGFLFTGKWFDIGDFNSYRKAKLVYGAKK